ncbi:MAG: hypothetical protein V7K71_30295 [Nostoc sp.]|uniref:hypothetical protein n=1 Tax=Nostoc sp. TaxID=1180 RepID=UPI002FF7B3CA
MIEHLMHTVNQNTEAFADLLFGFYLDGDAVTRQQIELEILDLTSKHKNWHEHGQDLVQRLRELAQKKGL